VVEIDASQIHEGMAVLFDGVRHDKTRMPGTPWKQ